MGLDWNKLQPPKYFTETLFEELYGTEATLTHTETREEEVGKDKEPKGVAHFAETPIGLVLNVTNRKALQAALGMDSDTWPGARITLTLKREGIRVTAAVPASLTKFNNTTSSVNSDDAPFPTDADEVPF